MTRLLLIVAFASLSIIGYNTAQQQGLIFYLKKKLKF